MSSFLTNFLQISDYYKKLKRTVTKMNDCFGLIMLFEVSESMLWFSYSFLLLFNPGVPNKVRIPLTLYAVSDIVYLLMAAFGAKNMKKLEGYIEDLKEGLNEKENQKLSYITQDVRQNSLTLKAYEFPIDFGYIVSVFSTVLTYAFVLYQFQFIEDKTTVEKVT